MSTGIKQIQLHCQKTLKWVQNLGQLNKPNHLILFGTNGTGKTHLARACVNYLAKKKFTGLYESYQRFSLEIEKFQNQDNYRIEYIEKLMKPIFLYILDNWQSVLGIGPAKQYIFQHWNFLEKK